MTTSIAALAGSARDAEEMRRTFVDVLPSKVRTRDTWGYASLFAEDAVWCRPDVPDCVGPAAIQQGVAAILADKDIDPLFLADEVKVLGDYGYVFGRSEETLRPHDGSPATIVYSRELWVFHDVGGVWKIFRMIWNIKPSL